MEKGEEDGVEVDSRSKLNQLKVSVLAEDDPLVNIPVDVVEKYLLDYLMEEPRDLINLLGASPYFRQIGEALLTSQGWARKALKTDGMKNHFRDNDLMEEFCSIWPGWRSVADNFFDQAVFPFKYSDYSISSFPFLKEGSPNPFFGTSGMTKLWIAQIQSGGDIDNLNQFPNTKSLLNLNRLPVPVDYVKRVDGQIRFGAAEMDRYGESPRDRNEILESIRRWLDLVPGLNVLKVDFGRRNIVQVSPFPLLPHLVNLTLKLENVLGTCLPFMGYWEQLTTLHVSGFEAFLDEYDCRQKSPSVFPKLQRLSVQVRNWRQGNKLHKWKSPLKELEIIYPPGSEIQAGLHLLNIFADTLALARIVERKFESSIVPEKMALVLGQDQMTGWDDVAHGDNHQDRKESRLPKLRVLFIEFLDSPRCVCALRSLAATLGYLQVKVLKPELAHVLSYDRAHTHRLFNPRIWSRMPALMELRLETEVFRRDSLSLVTDEPLKERFARLANA